MSLAMANIRPRRDAYVVLLQAGLDPSVRQPARAVARFVGLYAMAPARDALDLFPPIDWMESAATHAASRAALAFTGLGERSAAESSLAADEREPDALGAIANRVFFRVWMSIGATIAVLLAVLVLGAGPAEVRP